MRLPACHKANAARVITRTLQRQERAKRWRALGGGLAYLGRFVGYGVAAWLMFFGVVALVKG